MKKPLKIAFVVLAVAVLAMWGYGRMQVGANNDALSEIKSAPGVIVLKVDGMT
ncbi:MAG: hypothetical protein P1V36_03245 [Planctomycetota bacterium]|nr:hypothetical protein [Planctomycetota bacterium]